MLTISGCTSTRPHSTICSPPAPLPDSALLCVYRVADSAPSDKAAVLVNEREIGRLPKQSGIWLQHKPGDVTIVACFTDGRDIAMATNRLACVAGSTYFLRIEFQKVVKGRANITVGGPGETVTPLVVGGIPIVRHQPLLQIIREMDARAELSACVNVPAWIPSAQ